jgi:serine/threonine-protein kinase
LRSVLAEITGLVRDISNVRSAAALEQRKLEEIDVRGRDGRQRFGFAVDALGLDLSRSKDELRAAQAERERLAHDSERAAKTYRDAQREVITWEGRSGQQEPHAQLAEAYRACADAVDVWREGRRRERTATQSVELRERTVSDLDYQIAQLRAALASHEQAFDRDREAAQKRVAELNARAERTETELIQLASRFCTPLRSQPELHGLFQQLESEAGASG